MHPAEPELSPRDSALWRVGRNLQRFLSIEALLECCCPQPSYRDRFSRSSPRFCRTSEPRRRPSLGTLTETYSRQVLGPKQDAEEPEIGSEIPVLILAFD